MEGKGGRPKDVSMKDDEKDDRNRNRPPLTVGGVTGLNEEKGPENFLEQRCQICSPVPSVRQMSC